MATLNLSADASSRSDEDNLHICAGVEMQPESAKVDAPLLLDKHCSCAVLVQETLASFPALDSIRD